MSVSIAGAEGGGHFLRCSSQAVQSVMPWYTRRGQPATPVLAVGPVLAG